MFFEGMARTNLNDSGMPPLKHARGIVINEESVASSLEGMKLPQNEEREMEKHP